MVDATLIRSRGRGSLVPGRDEALAVEEPQDPAHDEQDELVDRAGNGQQSECTRPPQRPRYSTVLDEDLRGPNRSGDSLALPSSDGLGSVAHGDAPRLDHLAPDTERQRLARHRPRLGSPR